MAPAPRRGGRRPPVRLGALLGAALACAGPSGAAPGAAAADEPMHEAAAGYGKPEPNPACRATAQAPLQAYGLDRVVVKIGVDRAGKVALLEFLTPDLTPAAAAEVRRALVNCLWKPGLGPDGRPAAVWMTLPIDAGR